jgi:hypothetical protein
VMALRKIGSHPRLQRGKKPNNKVIRKDVDCFTITRVLHDLDERCTSLCEREFDRVSGDHEYSQMWSSVITIGKEREGR